MTREAYVFLLIVLQLTYLVILPPRKRVQCFISLPSKFDVHDIMQLKGCFYLIFKYSFNFSVITFQFPLFTSSILNNVMFIRYRFVSVQFKSILQPESLKFDREENKLFVTLISTLQHSSMEQLQEYFWAVCELVIISHLVVIYI